MIVQEGFKFNLKVGTVNLIERVAISIDRKKALEAAKEDGSSLDYADDSLKADRGRAGVDR